MANIFSINTIFFTFLDYPMSYIEFFGTIFTIWCVWLTVKAKVLSWPIGIIGSALYLFLFYQIQLYSDLFEQVYFLITSLIGWWIWLHPRTKIQEDKNKELRISKNSIQDNILWVVVISAGTILLTYVMSNLNIWLPKYFPEKAAYPLADAFTTVMSFSAQWLLAKKKIENWVLWIIVDAISIWIYWFKGVKFVSIEYMLFFVLASKGLLDWIKEYKKYDPNHEI